ncbi:glycosyltransferase [Marinicrinis sediminis]|uniref:Glycosyltransferase n=1 Tax=Marinicrinis sediminis TaxID=1652465 RepID=A0ABW5RD91_9BACL
MTQPSLSLCMIVKNEERMLEQCLQSAAEVVDEMIIVDTGSTDRTVDIASSFNARVIDFPWTHHFAEARNAGIREASSDWILWMDADEELDTETTPLIKPMLGSSQKDVLSVELINYFGKERNPYKTFRMAHPRIFRNHMNLSFTGAIHEMLDLSSRYKPDEVKDVVGTLPVKLYHYGYLDQIVASKQKHERNVKLLEEQLQQRPDDGWLYYHLASEYYRVKDFAASFTHINQSILRFIMQGQTPPSLVYKLKYSILVSTASFDGASSGIEKAVQLYPDYVDLQFYRAVIYLYTDQVKKAIEVFDLCLELGDDHLQYLCQHGLGSFQAYYYRGLAYEKLGQQKEALESYEAALQLYPTFEEAIIALNDLEKQIKKSQIQE